MYCKKLNKLTLKNNRLFLNYYLSIIFLAAGKQNLKGYCAICIGIVLIRSRNVILS